MVTVDGFTAKPEVLDVSDPYAIKKIKGTRIKRTGKNSYQVSLFTIDPDTEYLAISPKGAVKLQGQNLTIDMPSDLLDTLYDVDYLVITPEVLAEPARRLAGYRRGR